MLRFAPTFFGIDSIRNIDAKIVFFSDKRTN